MEVRAPIRELLLQMLMKKTNTPVFHWPKEGVVDVLRRFA